MGTKRVPDTKTNWPSDRRSQNQIQPQSQKTQNPWGGGLEYLHHNHVSRKRWQKGNPVPGGNNWATLFLGDIITVTWPYTMGESQMRQ
jgi:hypothetical protein